MKRKKSLKERVKGFKAFGIQNGGECWTGPNAEKNYKIHGIATNCENGKGGSWANDVYFIEGEKQCHYSTVPY